MNLACAENFLGGEREILGLFVLETFRGGIIRGWEVGVPGEN